MAIFRPKPCVNPFGKVLIFRFFWTFCFHSVERNFFVLESRKRHFPGLNYFKKKVGQMAIFGPKPWVNPLGKMSIFRLFLLVVFLAQKGVFSFWNIVKDIFLAKLLKKKKLKKWPFFDQKHGLTTLEKCQFLDFLDSLFLQRRKAFFLSRIS